jgi:hypothetical protein
VLDHAAQNPTPSSSSTGVSREINHSVVTISDDHVSLSVVQADEPESDVDDTGALISSPNRRLNTSDGYSAIARRDDDDTRSG